MIRKGHVTTNALHNIACLSQHQLQPVVVQVGLEDVECGADVVVMEERSVLTLDTDDLLLAPGVEPFTCKDIQTSSPYKDPSVQSFLQQNLVARPVKMSSESIQISLNA